METAGGNAFIIRYNLNIIPGVKNITMDITTEYNPTVPTELCSIMGHNRSDKGSSTNTGWHNYTTFYYSLFIPVRHQTLRVFELGLGTNRTCIPSNMGVNGVPGASLRGWREFFPNSSIFGADIDTVILFNEDRIKTYYCDQTNPSIISNMWANTDLSESFDIILDDGLHTFEANVCFFENSINKLAKGGVFIIEDILSQNINRFHHKLNTWRSMYPHLEFRLLEIPHYKNRVDNNILIAKYV